LFVTSSSRHILPTTVTFTLTLVLSLHCDGWRLLLLLLYFVHGTAGLQRDEKLRLSVYPCGACFLFVTSSGHSSNLHILPTTVTFTLTLRRLFVHFVDRGVANAAVNQEFLTDIGKIPDHGRSRLRGKSLAFNSTLGSLGSIRSDNCQAMDHSGQGAETPASKHPRGGERRTPPSTLSTAQRA
jgi:hypothetical protein